jgi:hypothetical protein
MSSDRPPKVKFAVADGRTNEAESEPESTPQSGLDKTVLEFLLNYEPSSSSKKPLWCRICRFQGDSLEEFNDHKLSDSHTMASEKERELSYCKLCRKQFTSPDQLKGHLIGKGHKETLDRFRRNHKQQNMR